MKTTFIVFLSNLFKLLNLRVLKTTLMSPAKSKEVTK